jgi:hypothetical protein
LIKKTPEPTYVEQPKSTTMLILVIGYLKTTPIWKLFLHALFLGIVSLTFSAAYLISFHFNSVLTVYDEAHSVQSFGTNLKTSVENDNAIYADLNRLLADNGGMRAYLYRYHNGLAAINGVPFFFQTMTHEVISPGTSRIMSFEQRIPASIHLAINNAFVNDKCSVIKDTNRDKDNQDYYFWLSRGARHLIRCPIYMGNGDLFGCVGVDFATDMANPDDAIKRVRDTAVSITKIFQRNH